MKIANRDARQYVQRQLPFSGNNLYGHLWSVGGEPTDGQYGYAVFSYGPHWPLWVHTAGRWYGNEDKYGTTTSKHKTQTWPLGNDIIWLDVDGMRLLVAEGLRGLTTRRISA
jgi:hypothetical protein